jgi:hypothetical protein
MAGAGFGGEAYDLSRPTRGTGRLAAVESAEKFLPEPRSFFLVAAFNHAARDLAQFLRRKHLRIHITVKFYDFQPFFTGQTLNLVDDIEAGHRRITIKNLIRAIASIVG